jgi:hypothetical protein
MSDVRVDVLDIVVPDDHPRLLLPTAAIDDSLDAGTVMVDLIVDVTWVVISVVLVIS